MRSYGRSSPSRVRIRVSMNYLAHGYRFCERPYFVAGTALPDWLRALGFRLRAAPAPDAGAPAGAEAGALRDLEAGVRRHLADDAAFHQQPAFTEAWREITRAIRRRADRDPRLRAHFFGHILAEMLLDAAIARRVPDALARYYAALEDVDPEVVESAAATWLSAPPGGLGRFIDLFRRWRFLEDYARDAGIIHRLGQVARRAGLPSPPRAVAEALPEARRLVEARWESLIDLPAGWRRGLVLSGGFRKAPSAPRLRRGAAPQ